MLFWPHKPYNYYYKYYNPISNTTHFHFVFNTNSFHTITTYLCRIYNLFWTMGHFCIFIKIFYLLPFPLINNWRYNNLMNIDISFDFRDDVRANTDPDIHSKTLKLYHKILWSKPLPSGNNFPFKQGW